MGIYLKTSSGVAGLTPYGFSEVYEKTAFGAVLLYQAIPPYLLLYGDGDMQEAVTGGWSVAWKQSGSYSTITNKYNGTNGLDFYVTADDGGSNAEAVMATENAIDVSRYNTLNFNLYYFKRGSSAYNSMPVGYLTVGGRATRTAAGNTFNFSATNSSELSSGSPVTLSVDVSGVTGSYYIGAYIKTGAAEYSDILLLECSLE